MSKEVDEFSLDLESILTADQLGELGGILEDKTDGDETQPTPKEKTVNNANITEGLTAEELFDSEGVGNEGEEKNQGENTPPIHKGEGDSPDNLYSSFAEALKVDGVLSHLDDEDIKKVADGDGFLEAMQKQVNAMFDEETRRIKEALEDGVPPSAIKVYESSIKNLNAVTDDAINDESEDGIALRENLIYSNFINKGFSKERAKTLTDRIIGSATEVEDAKEALQSMKEFYESKYNEARDKAHKEAEAQRAEDKKNAEKLRNDILKESKAFGGIEVDEKTRRRIYEAITKPVGKDAKGNPLTELEKFADENRSEFMKCVGYAYILTDGFKNLKGLAKPVEREAKKNGLRELESKLNSTMRNPDGTLRMVRGSYTGDSDEGWSINL